MALIIADRVKETTTTTGTGNISLSGATFGGFQTFAEAIGDGNVTYYCIQNDSQFEIGIGTYTASTNTLSRDTIFQSSNSDNKINIDGIGIVFSVVPADRLVYKDADDAVVFPTPFAFKRSDDGDYWQAYSTDYTNRVTSFFLEEGTDPTWKIGLKTSTSQIVAPYYAYVSAKDGFIELRGNANSILSIGDEDAQGLQVNHQLKNIIDIRKNGGEIAIQNLDLNSDQTTTAKNGSVAYTVFAVESSAGHASDLQTWSVATDQKASLDQYGDFETVGNVIAPSGRFNAVRFSDGSVQTTAALPFASGALIDQNAADIVTQSGYFQSAIDLIDSATVSGNLQVQIDQNVSDISATSGYFESRVDQLDSDVSYVSGVAVYGSGHNLQTVSDNGASTTNALTITNNNITASSGLFDSLDMTPLEEAGYPAHQEGVVFYDSENHTLSLYNDEADVTLQLGQEEFLRVRNNTGATITNGTAVLITGSHGNAAPTISGAIATSESASQIVGLATHDIEDNSFGYVTTYGIVRNVDTSHCAAGDEIFLSATEVGSGVNVSPTIPNYKVTIGHVIRSHGNNGSILVQIGHPKLGGGDLKSEAELNVSGVPFVTTKSDTTAGGSQTDPLFIFDSGNRQLQLGSGLQLLDGQPSNTTNVLYNDGGDLYFNGSEIGVSGESLDFAGNILTYNNSKGGSFTADLSSLSTFDTSGVSLAYSAGTLTYTNNAGGSFDVDLSSISGDVYALIVDGAPATLDTLNEIAAALNDDANIATTLTNLISTTSGNLQTQITSNDGDITQLNSDIATVSGLLYDDSAVSGYFESRVDAADSNISTNSSSITANSGYFESRVDSADSNISVVSGLIPPNTFSITGGDGNDYTIDGMGLNSAYDPTIYMHKGQTYTFNKTFSGHPFRVSTTDGGSVYSDADGTAIEIGSAAGSVTFEIPQDAPDKLYYYCTAHASSMKGIIYTTTDGSLSGYFESRVDSADTNISTNSSSITANSGYFESRVDQADADIATVSGLLYDDSAVSGYFESRVDANTADIVTVSGIAGLTVRDIDGTPSISNVTTIRVTNGSLTDNGGGTVTIATSGSGGGSSYDDAAISGYFESRVDSADSAITANSGYFESRVDSADSTATANSGYFESRVDTNASDIITVSGLTGGSSSLTVRDVDGTPSVSNVTTIEVTNGSLTDQGGGVVRIATSGSGGGGGGASSTGVPSGVGFFDDSGSLSGNNTFIYDGSDVRVSGKIFASGEQVITSDEIFHIKQLTQAEYDSITPDSATFYIITDVGSSPSIQSYREVSSDTTILSTDYTINATASLVLTLPTAVGNEGLLYNIKNTGTGNVIVSGVSSQTIDNELSFEISTQYQSIKLQSTNSNWIIL